MLNFPLSLGSPCISLVISGLTSIGEISEHGALHGEFVEVRVEEGEDSDSILDFGGSRSGDGGSWDI